jgi:hypothetical protein
VAAGIGTYPGAVGVFPAAVPRPASFGAWDGCSIRAGQPAGLVACATGWQRVIYSYQGLTPPAGLRGLIRRGEAAGVIFFGSNIASTAQIARVISSLIRPTPPG